MLTEGKTRANVKVRPKEKKPTVYLKVVDFSIWNGVKFGIGFVIGTTIGSLIIAMVLGGLAFLLGLGIHTL